MALELTGQQTLLELGVMSWDLEGLVHNPISFHKFICWFAPLELWGCTMLLMLHLQQQPEWVAWSLFLRCSELPQYNSLEHLCPSHRAGGML